MAPCRGDSRKRSQGSAAAGGTPARAAALERIATSEPRWVRRFRVPSFTFPSWARDRADRLVYVSNETGKYEVHTWDLSSRERRRLTDRPEGTARRVAPALEPSGERVWWFDDARGNELGTWVRERFVGGDGQRLAGALAPAYSAGLAIGSGVAVMGRSRADEGSTIHVLRDGAPARIYAHPESARVAELSRDETLVAFSHSEHGDARNRALRIVDLEGRHVAELWDGAGLGAHPLRWSPMVGDARLLALHERDGLARPLILDARTGQAERIALDLPGETSADWFPKGDALLVNHAQRGRSELFRLELASRSLTRIATAPGTIEGARVRPDGTVWYLLDSSSAPLELRAAGAGEPLLSAPGADGARGVTYSDHDVGDVHVFVAEPSAPRPHPTYVYVHGGPEAQDRDSFSPRVQAWVDHGFAVVMANYRGSSGYGKKWRDAIVGRPGLTELEDIASVHDWAVRSGVSDPRRSVLGGGSWGGYLTLLGLGTQPKRWAAGVAIVPIGDYVAAFEDEMEPLKRYDAALFGGTPAEVPDIYRRSNPITYIDRVRAPVLFLIGENDPRCPARGAHVYLERLRGLGRACEEYRYDAGHGSLVVDEQVKQLAIQIDFVARHLRTTGPLGIALPHAEAAS